MSTTEDSQASFPQGLIRWRGCGLMVVLFAFAGVYYSFFAENHFRKILQESLSEVHGAAIDIESLKLTLFPPVVEFHKVEFGNVERPNRNLFELDKVRLEMAFGPLLRKKLIIESMEASGVRYATARSHPATLVYEFNTDLAPSLMDRAATGIYASIRNELIDNPLRHLGQLGTGLSIQSTIEFLFERLQTVATLKELSEQLNEKGALWEKYRAELPTPAVFAGMKTRLTRETASQKVGAAQTEVSESSREITERMNQVRSELTDIRRQVLETQGSLGEDVTQVRRQLGLPRTDFDDLTELTFGPRWLSLLERLSYWIDLSRRRMPPGTTTGTAVISLQGTETERSFHFGLPGTLPTFHLKKATLHSEEAGKPNGLKIQGEVTGLTSDPSQLGQPLNLKLTADYPEMGFRDFSLDVFIDHKTSPPQEKIDLKLGSFRLTDWSITEASDITLKIANALTNLELKGAFQGEEVHLDWNIGLSDINYTIASRFNQVETTLKEMLNGMYSFDVKGSIEGSGADLRLTTSSGLGKQLAEGLKHEFRHQFGAIDESIRSQLVERFATIRDPLLSRVREYNESLLPQFETAIRTLNGLKAETIRSSKNKDSVSLNQ